MTFSVFLLVAKFYPIQNVPVLPNVWKPYVEVFIKTKDTEMYNKPGLFRRGFRLPLYLNYSFFAVSACSVNKTRCASKSFNKTSCTSQSFYQTSCTSKF